ncbi:NAD-dependent epimerase/dehydratase family protein, partial [Butyricicoccus sp. 1XD8-22]
HIGPGQSEGFVTTDFAKQIVELESALNPSIYVGDLSSRRDFTDVRDIVRAYLLLIGHGEVGEIYNICSGQSTSIQELLNYFLSFSTNQVKVVIDESKIRPIEFKEYYGSNEKITEISKWEKIYSLEESLLNIYSYLKNVNK